MDITVILRALCGAARARQRPEIQAGYDNLRRLLLRRCGDPGDVSAALAALERRPESASCHERLEEALGGIGRAPSPELLAAAQRMLEVLQMPSASPEAPQPRAFVLPSPPARSLTPDDQLR